MAQDERHCCTHGARQPDTGDWFEAYVAQVLVPELRSRYVLIIDNLSSHKCLTLRERIEAAGASPVVLSPDGPDFHAIEEAFARLKSMVRKAAERTVYGLWSQIGKLVALFQPAECANYLANAAMSQIDQIPL